MNICEAVKKAKEISGFIVSTRWPYLAIEPTDTPDCCRVHGVHLSETRSSKNRWQPQTKDLCSDDWEVIGNVDELPLEN